MLFFHLRFGLSWPLCILLIIYLLCCFWLSSTNCVVLEISASVLMDTVRNVVYAVVGLIGLFIVVVAVVCISIHIYHCCSRRRRKRSDAVGDTGSRPSASSTAVDCQYITLQTNDGTAAAAADPTAPRNEHGNCESTKLQTASYQSDIKPPSYDEVMGFQWIYCIKMHQKCVVVVVVCVCDLSASKLHSAVLLLWNYSVDVNLCHTFVLCANYLLLLLQPFYGPLDFVWNYPGEPVPER